MKIDLGEFRANEQAFNAAHDRIAERAKQIQTPIPDPAAVMRLMAEPERNARRSRESLEALVQQMAELLNNQQKQINENKVSSERNSIATWISIAIAAGSFALAAVAIFLD